MTVTLTLPPDVENAIQEAARQQGQTPEEAINQALHKLFVPETTRQLPPYDPAGLMAALDSFEAGDEHEQRETLHVLMTAIDRDRPGQRSIFGAGVNPMPPQDEIG